MFSCMHETFSTRGLDTCCKTLNRDEGIKAKKPVEQNGRPPKGNCHLVMCHHQRKEVSPSQHYHVELCSLMVDTGNHGHIVHPQQLTILFKK